MPESSEIFLRRLETLTAWRAGAVLDVRPAEAFVEGHLRGAASLPLPAKMGDADALAEALPSIFLPPRETPLLVIAGDEETSAGVVSVLSGRGRASVTGLAWPESLADPALVERGAARRYLWRPPAWLSGQTGWLPPPAAGPVLDLGCGSGRAAVWLAERGYSVTGVDRQAEALDLGRRLAASRDVHCDFRRADLRREGVLPPGDWAVVLNFRFLQRELLGALGTLTRSGGVVLVRTFRDAPGYAGHPAARHRLRTGELLRWFPRGLFEILAHEESHDPDGRPAAGIVARRK